MRSRESSTYGWVVLGTFTFNYTLVLTAVFGLGLLLPEISDELSLSPSQQGWLASSVLFGNLLFEIPINWWASRYSPWRVASVSFLAAALLIAFGGWAATFAVLLIARVALGAAFLATGVPRTLLILQWIPRKHIGLANGVFWGALEGLFGIGYIVIPLILVWVDDWRTTLYIWAGACLVSSVFWFVLGGDRITPEYREHMQSQVKTPLISLLKYKEPWILGFGAAGGNAGYVTFVTFWPTFTGDEYGTAITLAGLVVGLVSIVSAPVVLGVSILPFFARRGPMVLALSGMGLSATYLGLLFTGYIPLMLLLGVINGIAFCFIPVVTITLFGLPGIKPREVAVAVALVFTMLWAGAAMGPLIAGFVQEATGDLRLGLIFTSIGPLTLAAAGLMLSVRGRKMIEAATAPIPGSR